jgi:hypothetical protein
VREFERGRLPSTWRSAGLVRRGLLTDRKISQYIKAGWYSAEFRKARKDFTARRNSARLKRQGNFDIIEGRLIYRPT